MNFSFFNLKKILKFHQDLKLNIFFYKFYVQPYVDQYNMVIDFLHYSNLNFVKINIFKNYL